MHKNLEEAAQIAIRQCMAVKKNENVLIIVDQANCRIGQSLFNEARKVGAEVVLMEMTPRLNDGNEPPLLVAEAMKSADVILIPTSKSLSHTSARMEASEKGARIATLPGITAEMMVRTLCADYKNIAKLSQKIANILNKGKIAHLTTPAGTDLTMNIEGRIAEADTGLNDFTGAFSNLPAGEAYVSPKEGTSQGTLVIDGAMGGIGVLTEPIKMTVKNGLVTNIFGNEQAEKLQKLLSAHGKDAFNIAELGVGTNDKAIITGKILEDEKVLGTVHVALGNNIGFGGNVSVPIHLDGILMNPTLEVDGKIIIKDGMQLL